MKFAVICSANATYTAHRSTQIAKQQFHKLLQIHQKTLMGYLINIDTTGGPY